MDVRLPIYKNPGGDLIGKAAGLTVTPSNDAYLSFSESLTENEEYLVTIDYYTDSDFTIDLYAGDSLLVSLGTTGTTHKMQTASFTYNGGLLHLKLVYNKPGAVSAYVAEVAVRRLSTGDIGIRYVAEKWEFHDNYMGERNVTLTATYHAPIDWEIGDYIIYRGQTYYLNAVPTAIQNGRSGEAGDSFVYENLKFDDDQGKMYDCMVLDITPTTGDYIASEGTNYTGSSVFTIYCAETTVRMQDADENWHDVVLSPVAYLAGLAQANLNRLYPRDGWKVDVNPNISGLDDKVISINKWYVPQLLAEIHNQWDVDYICIGRTIKIGYTLNNITGNSNNAFFFGYGEGYAQYGDDGKSLFQIRRTSDSSRRIITRLRAMGSTRNMPYRYYNKTYPLPQSMFVNNLQLPDTFATPATKASNNANRDSVYGFDADGYPIIRHVLGDSNDAYIDKHDAAADCNEGIREGFAAWDGTDSDLEEIYPTIKNGTYRDLRGANIPDREGRYPSSVGAHNAYPNYLDDERIDEILGVDERTNVGNGIMTENEAKSQYDIIRTVRVAEKTLTWLKNGSGSFSIHLGNMAMVKDVFRDTLFSIDGVKKGKYMTEPVTQNVKFYVKYAAPAGSKAKVRFYFELLCVSPYYEHLAGSWSDIITLTANGDYVSIDMPSIPNTGVTSTSDDRDLILEEDGNIVAMSDIMILDCSDVSEGSFIYKIDSDEQDVVPEYIWGPQDVADTFLNSPFCIYIKDIGIDLSNIQTTGEDATIHFNTGACGGMDFKWNPNNVKKIDIDGKEGWEIEITERFVDNNIHVYYPSEESPISIGDNYVLLNIEFPDTYIKLAEMRLLEAATEYLADNCEPKYIYEPFISEIYIQQNIDICESQGTPSSSIYWNIYAGFRFSMRGIPNNDEEVLPIIEDIIIKTVTIKEGEQDTPIIEIVLNDEIDQSSIQKLTVSVNRIYDSMFGNRGNGTSGVNYSTLVSLLGSEGAKLFLSKKKADIAKGVITFKKGLKSEGDVEFGAFTKDASGAGIYMDGDGNWHFESDFFHVRKKLTAKEIQVEEVTHIGGQQLLTAARMVCDFIVEFSTYWRCFFLKENDNGKRITNQWKIGDQAYVCTFNLERQENGVLGNHYLWRRVVGTSNTIADANIYEVNGEEIDASMYHFIDLSKTVAGNDSDAPLAGDEIVQLGYQDNDPDRENAIIIAGAGTASPYIRQFTGITSFSLPEPETQLKPGDNILTGKVLLKPGSSFSDGTDVDSFVDEMNDTKETVDNLSVGNENLLRNSGFTGDYETEDVDADSDTNSDQEVYSNPLKYWDSLNVTILSDARSASGYTAGLTGGMLRQTLYKPFVATEWYCLTFRASGVSVRISIGGHEETITLSNSLQHYVVKFQASGSEASTLTIDEATGRIMELQLTQGTVPNTDWLPSPMDNDKAIAYYQNLSYLSNAINNASTTILGGLILSQMIRVGNYRNGSMAQETGGMSGIYSSEQSPFLWGGGTMEQAFYTIAKYAADPSYQATPDEVVQMAKFVVTHGGRAILNDIVLRGYIYALGGYFKGEIQATSGSFKSSHNGNTISINAAKGDITMSGPSSVNDDQDFTPNTSSNTINLLRLAFETDPDSLTRFATLLINSALGGEVSISALDGLKIATLSGYNIRIKDDEIEITHTSGDDSYSTYLRSDGIEINYDHNGTIFGDPWRRVSLSAMGRLTLTSMTGVQKSGIITVDGNGFLKLT